MKYLKYNCCQTSKSYEIILTFIVANLVTIEQLIGYEIIYDIS